MDLQKVKTEQQMVTGSKQEVVQPLTSTTLHNYVLFLFVFFKWGLLQTYTSA